jgi:hypothetical protein
MRPVSEDAGHETNSAPSSWGSARSSSQRAQCVLQPRQNEIDADGRHDEGHDARGYIDAGGAQKSIDRLAIQSVRAIKAVVRSAAQTSNTSSTA